MVSGGVVRKSGQPHPDERQSSESGGAWIAIVSQSVGRDDGEGASRRKVQNAVVGKLLASEENNNGKSN